MLESDLKQPEGARAEISLPQEPTAADHRHEPEPLPLVSVVILSYSRPQYIREVLESVLLQSHQPLEVILVDNRSVHSPQIARIAAGFASVRLISNSSNVGFAHAMNQGVNEAKGSFIFLTEDDIVLDHQCIETLLTYHRLSRQACILSGVQYDRRAGTVRSAGAKLDLGPVFKQRAEALRDDTEGQLPQPFGTDFVPGSMIFARTDYLREMGPFRTDFFMYMEDTDLCLRIKKRSDFIIVVPAAKSWHFEPDPAPPSDEIEFHKLKNFFALYILHSPVCVWPEFFIRNLFLPLFRAAIEDRGRVRLLGRASLYVVVNLKGLLKDRWSEAFSSSKERKPPTGGHLEGANGSDKTFVPARS